MPPRLEPSLPCLQARPLACVPQQADTHNAPPAGVVKSVRLEASPSASPTDKDHRLAFTHRRVRELDIFADNVDTILEVAPTAVRLACTMGRAADNDLRWPWACCTKPRSCWCMHSI